MKKLDRDVQKQIASRARQVGIFGFCGVLGVIMYGVLFGDNSVVRAMNYLFVALWLIGMVVVLGLRGLSLTQSQAGARQGKTSNRTKSLGFLAIILCAMPAPWLYFLSRTFGGPSAVPSVVAYAPAITFLVIGIGLLFFVYLRWLGELRSRRR